MSKDEHHEREHRVDWDVDVQPDPDRPEERKKVLLVPRVKEIKAVMPAVNGRPARILSEPQDETLVVADPSSVVPNRLDATVAALNGKLKPMFPPAKYQAHLFEVSGMAVPNRIAAVVPHGLADFSRVLLFFHPLPTKRAGFDPAQYAAQTGDWPFIYRYCDVMGGQLAASGRKMVLIVPVFNLASTETCGQFPQEWLTLVPDVLTKLRNFHHTDKISDPKPVLTEVVAASFSAGVKFLHTFLSRAKGLSGRLKEVYDFDGRFSSEATLSEKLASPGVKVVAYDQQAVKTEDVAKEDAAGRGIHLPDPRWRDLPNNRTSFLDLPLDVKFDRPVIGSNAVHGAIVRNMLFHALSRSAVGK